MALTVSQQLQLVNGTVKPPNELLIVLVHQTALVKAKQIYDGYKNFDTSNFPLAQSYLEKMLRVSDSVFRKQGDIIEQINRVLITIIGASSFTMQQVQAADTAAWESFLLDQIDEAFEYLSGVRKEEKIQYNSLP